MSFDPYNVPKPLYTFCMRIEFMKRRLAAIGEKPVVADNRELVGGELVVIDKICSKLETDLVKISKLSAIDAKQLVQACIDFYGKGTVVDFFISETLILSVPVKWFQVNAFINFIAFYILQNFFVLMAIAPLGHLLCYFYYQQNKERMQQEKINRILTEGIKI